MEVQDSISILLADDDPDDVLLFAEAALEVNSKVNFLEARDGKEAIDFLTANTGTLPRIIFLDVNMPLMNGWETLDAIKRNKKLSHIPVVMYSTSSQDLHVQRALQSGALFFWTKPDTYKKIKNVLTEIFSNLDDDNLVESVKAFPGIHWRR